MPFTASKDKEYGNCYSDISKREKRLIRATRNENTGTYDFFKLFKRKDNEYEQRISLTTDEVDNSWKKVAGSEIRCQSQTRKETSVAKKPVSRKLKLAEKEP